MLPMGTHLYRPVFLKKMVTDLGIPSFMGLGVGWGHREHSLCDKGNGMSSVSESFRVDPSGARGREADTERKFSCGSEPGEP